jgi:hypothetical protein
MRIKLPLNPFDGLTTKIRPEFADAGYVAIKLVAPASAGATIVHQEWSPK